MAKRLIDIWHRKYAANEVSYDNLTSGLSALTTQAALDELAGDIASGIPSYVKVTDFASLPAPGSVPVGTARYVQNETGSYLTLNKRKRGWYESDGASWKYAGDNSRLATDSYYDPTTSGLASNNVQGAVDALDSLTDTHIANQSNPHQTTFTQAVTADAGTDISAAEAEQLTDGSNADALHDHDTANLTNGAGFLNETSHDALPADNPHAVTFTQAVAADGGTDILDTEAETLTDGSNADSLHVHSVNNLQGVDLTTTVPQLSDMLEFDGTNWVVLRQREEGVVKINNIATALLVTDGTTYTIAPATPLTFSTATRFPLSVSNQFPGQTPQANEATFRPFIFDTATNKWLENSKDLQVHLWRIRVNYTKAGPLSGNIIVAELNNPLSGFTIQDAFQMPGGIGFQTFETAFYFLTIADSASIGFGYLLTLTPQGEDITINDLDLVRVSEAVL